MGRARYVVALLVALTLTGAPRPLGGTPPAEAAPLRAVASEGVTVYVPSDWEFRPMQRTDTHLRGVQASGDLESWAGGTGNAQGMNAFWVDATEVRLPSDYYVLAARGPAMESLPAKQDCDSDRTVFLGGSRRPHDLPRGYLATATGTCSTSAGRTRWAAFVAAPGFGPLREMGIPQSGMYFAIASVEDGPKAEEMLNRMLTAISFGNTQVRDFLDVVDAPGQLI